MSDNINGELRIPEGSTALHVIPHGRKIINFHSVKSLNLPPHLPHFQVLEYLLDMHEVSINGCDSLMGDTALTAASASGQNGSCLVLIRRGASISCANLKESFPLHMATRQGHWGVADTLLKEGADPNQLDGGQRTALMIAALEGHLVS